ncbi:abortive infection family protein [Oceanobacillus caeni]
MLIKQNNLYELLTNRVIIDILIGDTEYDDVVIESEPTIKAAMPYLSGPVLCDLCTLFGLPMTYSWNGGSLSRWMYMEKLLEHCIGEGSCSKLLVHLFDKRQFQSLLSGYSSETTDFAYSKIVEIIIDKINGILYFSENELVKIGDNFIIKPIGERIEINTTHVSKIDREYINSISKRSIEDIKNGYFDSAITKSRTLLEEVFCYVIEQKGKIPTTSGQINQLYRQVKDLYNMHADRDADRRINMLLSGFEKIVSSIAEMRNKDSDSHGVGSNRIKIEEHHATLFVNSAITLADFILAVENKSKIKQNTSHD